MDNANVMKCPRPSAAFLSHGFSNLFNPHSATIRSGYFHFCFAPPLNRSSLILVYHFSSAQISCDLGWLISKDSATLWCFRLKSHITVTTSWLTEMLRVSLPIHSKGSAKTLTSSSLDDVTPSLTGTIFCFIWLALVLTSAISSPYIHPW